MLRNVHSFGTLAFVSRSTVAAVARNGTSLGFNRSFALDAITLVSFQQLY